MAAVTRAPNPAICLIQPPTPCQNCTVRCRASRIRMTSSLSAESSAQLPTSQNQGQPGPSPTSTLPIAARLLYSEVLHGTHTLPYPGNLSHTLAMYICAPCTNPQGVQAAAPGHLQQTNKQAISAAHVRAVALLYLLELPTSPTTYMYQFRLQNHKIYT
jgi:hypothetical protein